MLTAAWYHALAISSAAKYREATSGQIAAGELPRFGYTSAEIDVISSDLSTRMPTAPTNWLRAR